MRYRTINIYSINDKGNHLYEYSTITKDTIKEVLIKHVKNDNTDDKLTKTSLHFKHLQNNIFLFVF